MNAWSTTAAKQLLEHWERCGLTRLPMPTEAGSNQAIAWLDALTIDSGLEAAKELQLLPSSVKPKELPTSAALSTVDTATVRESTVREANQPANATNADAVMPALIAKPPTVDSPSQPGNWQTDGLSIEDRTGRFQVLAGEVDACRKCTDIVCRRQRTVFGVGPVNARLVMFGEAPGAEEDRSGEPFVGAAGQLMDKILVASGLKRSEVFIMNSLKCRPPNNRNPTDGEIENCRPFFEAQLETIQPEYIVCWGSVAVRAVLKSTESVGRLRGRFHHYRGAKVLVTYHPAYLLRNPDAKRLTWEDMKLLMRELGIALPAAKK
jgi:uracil-DNA glycosylase family 4